MSPARPRCRRTPLFPKRDDLIAHIDEHVRQAGIEIRLETRVNRVDARESGWRAETDGEAVESAQMVIATSYEGEPMIPKWEGRNEFSGRLLHSADYRNPEPFLGERVLVVGSGCSGMEIAYDLAAGAAKVWLARRMDLGDLSEYGLPVPEEGVFSRFHRLGVVPSLDSSGMRPGGVAARKAKTVGPALIRRLGVAKRS